MRGRVPSENENKEQKVNHDLTEQARLLHLAATSEEVIDIFQLDTPEAKKIFKYLLAEHNDKNKDNPKYKFCLDLYLYLLSKQQEQPVALTALKEKILELLKTHAMDFVETLNQKPPQWNPNSFSKLLFTDLIQNKSSNLLKPLLTGLTWYTGLRHLKKYTNDTQLAAKINFTRFLITHIWLNVSTSEQKVSDRLGEDSVSVSDILVAYSIPLSTDFENSNESPHALVPYVEMAARSLDQSIRGDALYFINRLAKHTQGRTKEHSAGKNSLCAWLINQYFHLRRAPTALDIFLYIKLLGKENIEEILKSTDKKLKSVLHQVGIFTSNDYDWVVTNDNFLQNQFLSASTACKIILEDPSKSSRLPTGMKVTVFNRLLKQGVSQEQLRQFFPDKQYSEIDESMPAFQQPLIIEPVISSLEACVTVAYNQALITKAKSLIGRDEIDIYFDPQGYVICKIPGLSTEEISKIPGLSPEGINRILKLTATRKHSKNLPDETTNTMCMIDVMAFDDESKLRREFTRWARTPETVINNVLTSHSRRSLNPLGTMVHLQALTILKKIKIGAVSTDKWTSDKCMAIEKEILGKADTLVATKIEQIFKNACILPPKTELTTDQLRTINIKLDAAFPHIIAELWDWTFAHLKQKHHLNTEEITEFMSLINPSRFKNTSEQNKINQMFIESPATQDSQLIVSTTRAGTRVTWIKGAPAASAHHKQKGAQVAGIRLQCRWWLDAPDTLEKCLRMPSIAVTNFYFGMSLTKKIKSSLKTRSNFFTLGPEYVSESDFESHVLDTLLKLNYIFTSEDLDPTKPIYYNLLTSFPFLPDGKNRQKESAHIILQSAHRYNKQHVETRKPLWVINIPVNNHGTQLSHTASLSVIKEATLMAECSLLSTLNDRKDHFETPFKEEIDELYQDIERLYFQALSSANPKGPFNFHETNEGLHIRMRIANFKQTMQQQFNKYQSAESGSPSSSASPQLTHAQGPAAVDPVAPLAQGPAAVDPGAPPEQGSAAVDSPALDKKKMSHALLKSFSYDQHMVLQYGQVVQSMAHSLQEQKFSGCKSGNERWAIIDCMVELLAFLEHINCSSLIDFERKELKQIIDFLNSDRMDLELVQGSLEKLRDKMFMLIIDTVTITETDMAGAPSKLTAVCAKWNSDADPTANTVAEKVTLPSSRFNTNRAISTNTLGCVSKAAKMQPKNSAEWLFNALQVKYSPLPEPGVHLSR